MRVIPSRSTDPDTSHKAERSVAMRANSQKARLLKAFSQSNQPMIDEEAAQLAGINHPRACFWKRCGELREMGLITWVEISGEYVEKKSSAGEWCRASVITMEGIKKLKEME